MSDFCPPVSVRIAAAVSIVASAAALVTSVALGMGGYFAIGFDMLLIPLGWGLMRRNKVARVLSIAWALVGLAATGAAAWFGRGGGLFHLPPNHSGSAAPALAQGFVILAALFSRSARAWFRLPPGEHSAPGAGWTWPLVIAGALLASDAALRDRQNMQALDRVFPVDCTFHVIASDTGRPVREIGVFSSVFQSTSARQARTSRIEQKSVGIDGGVDVNLSGWSVEPFEVHFSSNGYEPLHVRIDRSSERSQRLVLQAKKAP